MTIAIEQNRLLTAKKETTAGTAAGASGAQQYTYSKFDINPDKDEYDSDEVTPSQQLRESSHGVRRASGSTEHIFRPGAYAAWLASLFRKAFAGVADITGLSITIAASGSYYTVTRATGSWYSDGVKVGHVGMLTAGSFTAGNMNNNLIVLSMTATVLTVAVGNGSSLTAEGPISSATWKTPGKVTMPPTSSQTDESYSLEDLTTDKVERILFVGGKPTGANVNMPPSGYVKLGFDWMFMDYQPAASAYFTSPTSPSTQSPLRAVRAKLRIGSVLTSLNSLSLAIKGGHSAEPQVGSDVVSGVLPGKLVATGQMGTFDQDRSQFTAFDQETEQSMTVVMFTSTAANADFVSFTIPRAKLNKPSRNKVGNGFSWNFTLKFLENLTSGAGADLSTITLQDSTQ